MSPCDESQFDSQVSHILHMVNAYEGTVALISKAVVGFWAHYVGGKKIFTRDYDFLTQKPMTHDM
jgi:hypothetical protein